MTDEPFTSAPPEPAPPEPESEPVPAPAPAEEPPPGAFQALTGVLFAPSATFQSFIRAKWHFFLWPVLAYGVLVFAYGQIVASRVDMGDFVREQLVKSNFASKMTPAQLDEAVENAKQKPSLLKSSFGLVIIPAFFMIIALIYWVTFLAFGANLKYWAALNIIVWAHIPKILLKKVLGIIILFLKDPSSINPMNVVLSNPSAFLGYQNLSPFWYTVLAKVDIFIIWTMVLYVLGLHAVSKLPKGKVFLIVLALAVLKILILAGAGQLFGMYFFSGEVP